MFPSLTLVTLLLLLGAASSQESLTWRSLDSRLPKALSDFTATLVEETGTAYLAGGCDSPDGNVFNATDGQFACKSISSAFYSFDIASETFLELTFMPRARYRHAAAVNVDGTKLWLVGGRDGNEDLITEVDVYDIASNTWETYGALPSVYALSDLGWFSNGNGMFLVGGYDVEYTSYDNVIRLDLAASTPTNLVVKEMATLATARGDVSVVADSQYAYASGGFSHTNDFCSALETVERYNVASNTWEAMPDLLTPRSDKGLVLLNGRLYAVGGERQIEGICDIAEENLPEAGELTVAVDDVEVLAEDGSEWVVLASLPNHRFRFAAISWDATNTIYSFGGQVSYDPNCQCFRTTDEVVAYLDERDTSGGALWAVNIGGVVAAIMASVGSVLLY